MLEIITGINLENWLLLDLPNQILPLPDTLWNSNCSKYYLYNDYFLGLLDGSVKEQAVEQYRKYSLQLNHALKEVKNYKIFFELIKKLCDVLEIKSVLGIKTRKAYKNHDIKELQNLLDNDYKIVLKRLKTFYECERKTWYLFNKGFGFEIQDVRLGGLIMRTKDCMECLRQYISGKVLKIEELENDILPYQGNLTKEEYLMSFGNIYSPSDLTLFN